MYERALKDNCLQYELWTSFTNYLVCIKCFNKPFFISNLEIYLYFSRYSVSVFGNYYMWATKKVEIIIIHS